MAGYCAAFPSWPRDTRGGLSEDSDIQLVKNVEFSQHLITIAADTRVSTRESFAAVVQHRDVDFLRRSAYLHRCRRRHSPAEDEDAGNRRGHGWVGGDWARHCYCI